VTEERFDPETQTTTELTAFPLSVGGDGAYLEARVESVPLPAAMTAKVQLTPDHPEQRFDFTFTALSRDPSPASMDTRMSMPAMPALSERAPAPAPGSPVGELRVGEAPDPAAAAEPPMDAGAAAAAPVAAPETAALPAPDPALVALPIPETIPGMLDQLRTRNRQIAELIDRGDLAAVWFPAFQAKDVAVALEARLADLAPSRREATAAALHRLVRLSWLLDAHGDTGNRQNVTDAHAAFSSAVDDVLTSIGRPSR
jgi:hypothetical protein